MHNNIKIAVGVYTSSFLLVLCAIVVGGVIVSSDAASATPPSTSLSSRRARSVASIAAVNTHRQEQAVRTAGRLQKRIENRFGFAPDLHQLRGAITQQRTLISASVTTHFSSDDGNVIPALVASVERFPMWMTIDVTPAGMVTSIDPAHLSEELKTNLPEGIRLSVDATLLSTSIDKNVGRAETDGIARSGYDFDPVQVSTRLSDALKTGSASLVIPLRTVAGKIHNATGKDLGELVLLSTGRSNFEGSGYGRKANVRRGLTEYLHNTMTDAGKPFSINSALARAPFSEWEMGLGIFDGGVLLPVAGGGLCQVATTLYRAALLGGFPILKRANHSLFVHYYEKYGVGIDATIFLGKQDLTFMNNTAGPLLVQAYVEGDEATVNVYGTPDGRVATLEGPYFSKNAPAGIQVNGRDVKSNEIVWKQTIVYADGRIEENPIISRYKSIPRSVVEKFMHAAAPEQPGI